MRPMSEDSLESSLALHDFIDENPRQRFARARERAAEEVEQAVASGLLRFFRHFAPSDSPYRVDKAPGCFKIVGGFHEVDLIAGLPSLMTHTPARYTKLPTAGQTSSTALAFPPPRHGTLSAYGGGPTMS